MQIIIHLIILGISLGICILTGDYKVSCYVLLVCVLVQSVVYYIFYRQREKHVDEVTMYLMKVQDQLELPEYERYTKGKLGVLQSEIYKLSALLNERAYGAQKEKEYLAKMLSDISHQIKTPLTSITILTELLKNPDLNEKKREEFLEKIDSQVGRITWLIRNLLTLSQLDAEILKLKKDSVNIYQILDKAVAPFEIMAEIKEIKLLVIADNHMEIVCDEHWMTEAVSNIVKNCIEHTKSGGIVEIRAEQSNFATDLWIRDNGEGISSEDIPHIFERFYKGSSTSKESVGIGLAMAKQIIMLSNGVIDVASKIGEGTQFHIKIYSEVNL